MVKRALGGIIAAVLLAPLAGCPCDSGLPDLFYDDFQAVCGGVPCEWTVAAGDVVSTESFHAGERGMRLAVGGDVSRALPDVGLPSAADEGALISLLVACDDQTTLVIEVEATSVVPARVSGEPEDIVLEARREPIPGERYGGVIGRESLPLLLPSGEEVPAATATGMRITIEGPGACIIDELHIAGARSFFCEG